MSVAAVVVGVHTGVVLTSRGRQECRRCCSGCAHWCSIDV